MEGDNMSLENELLKAADELEKTAMEMEKVAESCDDKEETPKSEEIKVESKEEEKEPKKEEEKEEESEEDKSEKLAALKEELGISDDNLAEKVASADPSVVEYLKKLANEQQVESMGGEDTREKTASEDDVDPFTEFISTPL
jgi:septal ring factor EnvC (AmiA/AmiB activator)